MLEGGALRRLKTTERLLISIKWVAMDNAKTMALAVSVLLFAGALSAPASAISTHVIDRQSTGQNDSVKCKQQPCSPDGKWQATWLSLKIDAPAGYHLENVKLTHSDNQPFPQFCSDPPDLKVDVHESTAGLKCWSASVTWTLEGDAVSDP